MLPVLIENKSEFNNGQPIGFKSSWGDIVTTIDMPQKGAVLGKREKEIILEALECGFISTTYACMTYNLRSAEIEVMQLKYRKRRSKKHDSSEESPKEPEPRDATSESDDAEELPSVRERATAFTTKLPESQERDGFIILGDRAEIVKGDVRTRMPTIQLRIISHIMRIENGGSVSIPRLTNAVWDGIPVKPAYNSVYQYLRNIIRKLRKTFGKSPIQALSVSEYRWHIDEPSEGA